MRIAITGATGLIGGALVPALVDAGHEIVVVSRRPAAAVRERFDGRAGGPGRGGASRALGRAGAPARETARADPRTTGPAISGVARWDPAAGTVDAHELEGIDAAVHLAGENIQGFWTAGKRERIRASRVEGTRLFARTLAGLDPAPAVVVSASGMTYYGARRPGETLDERSSPGEGFLAGVGRAWEAAMTPAEDAGIRVVNTRFGLVLSPRGGLLGVMLPLFRFGLGGRLGRGSQVWSWVAIDDVVGAVMHALGAGTNGLAGAELRGPVNVVSPNPVTQAEFVETLARVLGRPAFFRVPEFLPRLLLPDAQAEEMLLFDARVVPRRLEETGYTFRLPGLEPALRQILGRG